MPKTAAKSLFYLGLLMFMVTVTVNCFKNRRSSFFVNYYRTDSAIWRSATKIDLIEGNTAVILIDHGSRMETANENLLEVIVKRTSFTLFCLKSVFSCSLRENLNYHLV